MEDNNTRSMPVEQKIINPPNGVLVLVILLFLCLMVPVLFISGATSWRGGGIRIMLSIILCFVLPFLFGGLRSVRPNEALVLTLFGKYYGTIVKPGYFFVNPFARYNNPAYDAQAASSLATDSTEITSRKNTKTGASRVKKTVSLKRSTLDNGTQKVNDALGNPIIIGAVVLWHVEDPTKAVFNVENYTEFLSIQTDSTIRNMARLYPYDVFDDGLEEDTSGKAEQTLRGSSQEIAEKMQVELAEKVAFAGLVIEEVRITHIAYAEEIAAAMLQRQQASAIIAARAKIVDGAVSMVKMAIDKLSDEEIVELDQERKAQMVSNLLVVLCGNKDAQPIVNSGSVY
ncbi:MAG: SPFH domain-containing protein [Clostridiales bacterium]|nr:SPFH domain-containing protein [Clostridiales bacterium]